MPLSATVLTLVGTLRSLAPWPAIPNLCWRMNLHLLSIAIHKTNFRYGALYAPSHAEFEWRLLGIFQG